MRYALKKGLEIEVILSLVVSSNVVLILLKKLNESELIKSDL
jgi:hypothetical protein